MSVPNWYELALLALAAFRVFRLIAEDDILDRPRSWALRYGDWREGQALPVGYRAKWAEFLTCPWCAGFWISLAWWGAWQLWPHGTTVATVPFVISAAVGLVAKLDSD